MTILWLIKNTRDQITQINLKYYGTTQTLCSLVFGNAGYSFRRCLYMDIVKLLRSFSCKHSSSILSDWQRTSLMGGRGCNFGCCFPLNNCTDIQLLYFPGIGFVRMVAVSINDSRGIFVCFNSPFTVFHCASPRYISRFQNPIYSKCKSIVFSNDCFPLLVSHNVKSIFMIKLY